MSLTPLPLARQRCRGGKRETACLCGAFFIFFGNGQRVKSFFNAIFREATTEKKEQPPPALAEMHKENMSQNMCFVTNETLIIILYKVYIIHII